MIRAPDVIAASYPQALACIPDLSEMAGGYAVRFARDEDDLDRITKLRFEVFNLELREGLDESYGTCRDHDRFDAFCHHLMVTETRSGQVVGTYRMQTHDMAASGHGFYSDEEFDLAPLREAFLPNAVELGRACVAHAHRNSRVLFLLWRGLAGYVLHNRKRYFFGCCSLTSQDPATGWHVMMHLRDKGLLHQRWQVSPQPELACYPDHFVPPPPIGRVKLPRLMQMYMDYGARIAGPPAIDLVFKTIDYLALFDMQAISPRARRMFVD